MCNCRQNELEIELSKTLLRAMKRRSRLDALLEAQGYSDEAMDVERAVIEDVDRCRAIIDEMVRWNELPHRAVDCPHGETPF